MSRFSVRARRRSMRSALGGTLRGAIRSTIPCGIITLGCLLTLTLSSCTSASDDGRTIGILPPPAPQPLWLGVMRPLNRSLISGTAAVTLGDTPNSAHLMVSLTSTTPYESYGWQLNTGTCEDQGRTVVSSDTYPSLVPHADGTANLDVTFGERLTRETPYAVVVQRRDGNASNERMACGTLAFGGM